jgi:hypothetical protein
VGLCITIKASAFCFPQFLVNLLSKALSTGIDQGIFRQMDVTNVARSFAKASSFFLSICVLILLFIISNNL